MRMRVLIVLDYSCAIASGHVVDWPVPQKGQAPTRVSTMHVQGKALVLPHYL